MKRMMVALGATLAMAYAPAANADSRDSREAVTATPNPIPRGSSLPQTIHFPANVRGKGAGTTVEQLNFTINEFRRGRNGALCAVGTLGGGSGLHTVTDTVISVPAGPKGARLNSGDCNVSGKDDDGEEHGSLLRPGARVSPAVAAAELGVAAPAPFLGKPGGVIAPTQTTICDILTLVLGPIHLDLLGLVVDTNQIIVLITADPTGGLLGSLLSGLLC